MHIEIIQLIGVTVLSFRAKSRNLTIRELGKDSKGRIQFPGLVARDPSTSFQYSSLRSG